MHKIIKNDIKLRTLELRTGFSSEKVKSSFSLINLICKHFIYSLAGAGIVCNLLKYIGGVSRPKYFFLEGYDRINFFNFEHKVNSFPSGHT
ncbi:MAG: phosphatase PAP2 family protein, partial [Alphaproteobacteria bacterium]